MIFKGFDTIRIASLPRRREAGNLHRPGLVSFFKGARKVAQMEDQQYEQCIERLAKRVGKIHNNTFNETPIRKKIEDIAEQLEKLAAILEEQDWSQHFIETEHGDRHQQAGEAHWTPYGSAVQTISDLAESARAAAKTLPDPRRKYALPRAAEALLWLRRDFGYTQPSLSNTDPIITELARVCSLAGISIYSTDRLRRAVSDAMHSFDKHMRRDDIDDILYGNCQG